MMVVTQCFADDGYERLTQLMLDPHIALDPFQTDGCSGGMSASWRGLVKRFPSLAKHGKQPPWEACCIQHDKQYWLGGDAAMRKAADLTLKQCVANRGYPEVARVMYAAVRVGGKPCSGLPWRWGYGWPACHWFAKEKEKHEH